MDCLEAQSKMMDFVRDELDDDETEAFLEHVETCRECSEELQISYCVYEGIKMLDEDNLDSLNIQRALDSYIKHKKERLHRKHRRKKILFICVVVLGIVLLGALAVYSGIELPKLL